MLQNDAEYIPFEFPKLPEWVNCNLWDGNERPANLGPLKDPDERFQWKKETLEMGLMTEGPKWTEYLADTNWT